MAGTGALLKASGLAFPLSGVDERAFWELPGRERALLIAAHLCDVVKVREEWGPNRGRWVDLFVRMARLNPLGRYAWCASFVGACLDLGEFTFGPKHGRAAVRNWLSWARKYGYRTTRPQRGDLFAKILNPKGTGHMGFVVSVSYRTGMFTTIEGNTDAKGSREGDGLYRKTRRIADWNFIRCS
jgi:hypothetical protein